MNIKPLTSAEEKTIAKALVLLRRDLNDAAPLSNPAKVRQYLQLWLAAEPRELFGVLFLDTQHRVIAAEIMFQGTIDQAHIHPREVARRALILNATSVIVAHNHPSGNPEPSAADLTLTDRLYAALALLDIRLLDHFVAARGDCVSLAERGWRPGL